VTDQARTSAAREADKIMSAFAALPPDVLADVSAALRTEPGFWSDIGDALRESGRLGLLRIARALNTAARDGRAQALADELSSEPPWSVFSDALLAVESAAHG